MPNGVRPLRSVQSTPKHRFQAQRSFRTCKVSDDDSSLCRCAFPFKNQVLRHNRVSACAAFKDLSEVCLAMFGGLSSGSSTVYPDKLRSDPKVPVILKRGMLKK